MCLRKDVYFTTMVERISFNEKIHKQKEGEREIHRNLYMPQWTSFLSPKIVIIKRKLPGLLVAKLTNNKTSYLLMFYYFVEKNLFLFRSMLIFTWLPLILWSIWMRSNTPESLKPTQKKHVFLKLIWFISIKNVNMTKTDNSTFNWECEWPVRGIWTKNSKFCTNFFVCTDLLPPFHFIYNFCAWNFLKMALNFFFFHKWKHI